MIDRACADEQPTQIEMPRIMEMIPHRHPFLMIDRVVDAVADKRATGVKDVSPDEYYFKGHFPARPVMPGVLIIEAMAQTAAVLVVHTLGRESEGKLVYFMSIDKAKFRKPVLPGDRVEFHMTKTNRRRNMWWYSGRAMVDGALVCEAEIAAMIAEEDRVKT